jgi:hypothetical protein
MSTKAERADEARQEIREHPACLGCRLGLTHDHEETHE